MAEHELPSWTATLADLQDAMIGAAQNGRVTWLMHRGERTAAIVPPNGRTDAEAVRTAVAVLRRHRKRGKFLAGVFLRTLERWADQMEGR